MSFNQTDENLSWLINRMLESIPAARSVLLMSTDGLVRAFTPGLSKDEADTLAAAESGMWGIVTAIGQTVKAGGVRQVVVELDGAFLCVGAAGPGTCIGVLADRSADPRQIGFEMQRCVTAVVKELATAPRTGAMPTGMPAMPTAMPTPMPPGVTPAPGIPVQARP